MSSSMPNHFNIHVVGLSKSTETLGRTYKSQVVLLSQCMKVLKFWINDLMIDRENSPNKKAERKQCIKSWSLIMIYKSKRTQRDSTAVGLSHLEFHHALCLKRQRNDPPHHYPKINGGTTCEWSWYASSSSVAGRYHTSMPRKLVGLVFLLIKLHI